MCGIAGTVNWGGPETLDAMAGIQRHRGPDDSGAWFHAFPDGGCFGLASRRLAILDLSPAGQMPMSNPEGTLWITYNGEIYNFPELRRELESKGHRFRSRTDTEVILRLYEVEGAECVLKLNGMFAFAIADLRAGRPRMFLARDHFGVKPFYYVKRGNRFAFASEAKALLELPDFRPELNLDALQQYLTFLWVPDPDTMFAGIHKLPAGHYATWSDGRFDVVQYWDLTFPLRETQYHTSEQELAAAIRERFCQSVQRQMLSDVPVGAFLSAGLDSSSIVAAMVKASREPVRTYTITFPYRYRVGENTLDDPDVAARVAAKLGCQHETLVVEPEVTGLLPHLIWHMDEPVSDPAVITAFLVCRAAREHVTVLLSGVGGDELFAGYRKHAAHYWARAYRRVPELLRDSVFGPAVLGMPTLRGTPLKGMIRLMKKMVRSGSLPQEEAFLTNCTYLDDEERQALSATTIPHDSPHPWSRHRAYLDRVSGADFLHQMLYLDSKAFMVSLNLNYNDKMSMASSVEVRVPFLDREFVEFVAWHVPPRLKLKPGLRSTTKYIFRKAMAPMLPREVLCQPKAGFFAPIDYWLANDLREMVDDLLSEGTLRERGLFRPEVVKRFVAEHRSGRRDWSMQIWQLLTLELWMRAFLHSGTELRSCHLRAGR